MNFDERYKVELNLTAFELGWLTGIVLKHKKDAENVSMEIFTQLEPAIKEVYRVSGVKI